MSRWHSTPEWFEENHLRARAALAAAGIWYGAKRPPPQAEQPVVIDEIFEPVDVPQTEEPKRLGKLGIKEIVHATAEATGVDRLCMRGATRSKRYVIARNVASWIARERLGYSTPRIGIYLNRDHSTIIHAVNCVNRDFSKYVPLLNAVLAKLCLEPCSE